MKCLFGTFGLQKYQLLLAHMPSIYLTRTLSCELRFRMFIIKGYYTKSKRLQSLDFFLEDVIIYCVLFDLTGNIVVECPTPKLEPIH